MPKIALVEYFTTEEKILIFIIRPEDSEPFIKEANIKNSVLEECRDKLFGNNEKKILGDFQRIRPSKPFQVDLEYFYKLSQDLIFKFLDDVAGYDILYLVPHGWLHYLPLHALKFKDGKYLIEKFKVVYSPSATVIKYCQAKNAIRRKKNELIAEKSCLSLGIGKMDDPESLKETLYEEAKYVGEEVFSLRGECKIGQAASKKYFIEHCKDKEVIHVACHGYFNESQPLKSGLLFSNGKSLPFVKKDKFGFPEVSSDMLLTVEEIFNLELKADLVVLSACLTGVNKNTPGDELIGLARAFIYAGTPSVIVSLWGVYSDSTKKLIQAFFNYWTKSKEPMNKAEALQRAQLDLIANGVNKCWKHPYHWAPFILIGDWV